MKICIKLASLKGSIQYWFFFFFLDFHKVVQPSALIFSSFMTIIVQQICIEYLLSVYPGGGGGGYADWLWLGLTWLDL